MMSYQSIEHTKHLYLQACSNGDTRGAMQAHKRLQETPGDLSQCHTAGLISAIESQNRPLINGLMSAWSLKHHSTGLVASALAKHGTSDQFKSFLKHHAAIGSKNFLISDSVVHHRREMDFLKLLSDHQFDLTAPDVTCQALRHRRADVLKYMTNIGTDLQGHLLHSKMVQEVLLSHGVAGAEWAEQQAHLDLKPAAQRLFNQTLAQDAAPELVAFFQARGASFLKAPKESQADYLALKIMDATGPLFAAEPKLRTMPNQMLVASVMADNLFLAEEFIKAGGSPGYRGNLPLKRAAASSSLPMMEFLVDMGADLDSVGSDCLEIAAKNGKWATASFLLAQGYSSASANLEFAPLEIRVQHDSNRLQQRASTLVPANEGITPSPVSAPRRSL